MLGFIYFKHCFLSLIRYKDVVTLRLLTCKITHDHNKHRASMYFPPTCCSASMISRIFP